MSSNSNFFVKSYIFNRCISETLHNYHTEKMFGVKKSYFPFFLFENVHLNNSNVGH